ncbi:hypothetical protein ACYSNM_03525 [Myroides sp. LJL116]
MTRLKRHEIRVSKSVRPLDLSERKPFDLIIGEQYFISYKMNIAQPCKLLWRSDEMYRGFAVNVTIELLDGTIQGSFGDEIGRTPEEAVLNAKTL